MTTQREPSRPDDPDREREPVDFWFDPVCPWAWMSSRWLLEAATVRPLLPRFHVMSLAVLNEGRDLPDDYRRAIDRAWAPARICIAAETEFGADVLEPLYTALGTHIHVNGQKATQPVLEKALVDANLPTALVDAGTSTDHDERLRASHQTGIDRVGLDVGTPIISVDGVSFFGPVVTPAPKGDDAGRLWDGVLLVAGTPGFFELKRTRDRDPIFT